MKANKEALKLWVMSSYLKDLKGIYELEYL